MAWTYDKSLDRIQSRWARRSELDISVEKLAREMELENITLPKSRRLMGAHLYATVAGSGQLDRLDDEGRAAETVRSLSAWLAEASRIAAAFEVPVVAAQGARVHLLNYRPIDKQEQLTREAVLLAAALRCMTTKGLNPLLEEAARLRCRSGVDLGETVGTRGGTGGDSELLFLGSAANRGAKLAGPRKIVVSSRLYEALDEALDLTADELDDGDSYALDMTGDALADALDRYGIGWSLEKAQERLAEDLEKWPRERCQVSGASGTVRFDGLGRANSKLVEAAVLIADIDGFSAYIEGLEGDAEKRDAIVALDMMRFEFREVLKTDYSGGVRVQYQGDNIIGLVHMPDKEPQVVAERALEIAAGIQASMQHTLRDVVPEAQKVSVTVGVAFGDVLATQIGPRGRRNAMVVGATVSQADRMSAALSGDEVGFSAAAYEALPEALQSLFDRGWVASAGAYVASDLPANKLELARMAAITVTDQRRVHAPDRQGRSKITPAVGTAMPAAEDVPAFRPHSV